MGLPKEKASDYLAGDGTYLVNLKNKFMLHFPSVPEGKIEQVITDYTNQLSAYFPCEEIENRMRMRIALYKALMDRHCKIPK